MSPQIQLSVFTKFSGPLTKQLSLISGKVHSDSSECRMSNGIAERLSVPFDQLPQLFNSLTPMQAIATGWVNAEPSMAEIITRDKFEENNYNFPAHVSPQGVYATRTLQSIHQQGCSLVMFDHDHDSNSPFNADTPDEFIALLARVIPDFDNTTFIRTYSTSSSVYHRDTGECLRPADGFHIYMAIADGSDIQRFGEVLEKRLWLAGLGYIKVSQRNASLLKRTIVDTAVFSPERLIFEAGAAIVPGNPLVQRLPIPELRFKAHAILDTARLPDLSEAEEEAYLEAVRLAQKSEAVVQAKGAVKNKLTDEYIEQAQRQGKILSRRIAAKMVDGLERHILPPYHPIMFSNGQQVSILELVSNPFRFDGMSCYDPLRPDKGPDRAKFFANADQAIMNPVVYSFVEGGRTFNLKDSLRLLTQQDSVEDGEDLREIASEYMTQSNRYLEPFPLKQGWTFVKAEKGTGKTFSVAEVIKDTDLTVLAITHRISLTQSLSRDFNLACYNESEVSASHVLRSQRRLGICYDSLHKLAGQTYDIVVIDEVTQLMRHTKSMSVKQKFICLNVLRAILLNARYVIAMDADLSLQFIDILRDAEGGCIRPNSALNVVVNTYKPAKAQKRVIRLYEKDEGKAHERAWDKALFDYVATGKGTFVATNARVHAYNLANTIAKSLDVTLENPISVGHFMTEIPGHRIITITSDNTGDPDVADFITNLNTRLLPTDIFIASPSIGTGVSINAVDGIPKFERTFGRFSRRAGNTSGDCSQHLSRVRECKEYDLVVLDTKEVEKIDPSIIVEEAIFKKIQLIDRQVTSTELNFCPFRKQYVFMDGFWSSWFGKLTSLENLDRNEFTSNLLDRLVDEGYTLERVTDTLTEKAEALLKEQADEASQDRKAYELELLQAEILITDDELEALENKISITVKEKRQIRKRKIADTFGAYDDDELNPILALSPTALTSKRNSLMLGMNGETLFITDLVNRLDPDKQHIDKSAHFPKWNLIWQIASFVGVSLSAEGLPQFDHMVITDDLKNSIYEFLADNRSDVKTLLNYSVKWHKPCMIKERGLVTSKVLALIGLKLVRRKLNTIYFYEIDKKAFDVVLTDINRTKLHSPGNLFKTLVSPPKFLLPYVAQWNAQTPEKVKYVHKYVSCLRDYEATIFHNFLRRTASGLTSDMECT